MAVFTFEGSFSVLASVAADTAAKNIEVLSNQRAALIDLIEALQKRGTVLNPRIKTMQARVEETREQSWIQVSKWLVVAQKLGDGGMEIWAEEAAQVVESADKICLALNDSINIELAEAKSNAQKVYAFAKQIKAIEKEIDGWKAIVV